MRDMRLLRRRGEKIIVMMTKAPKLGFILHPPGNAQESRSNLGDHVGQIAVIDGAPCPRQEASDGPLTHLEPSFIMTQQDDGSWAIPTGRLGLIGLVDNVYTV